MEWWNTHIISSEFYRSINKCKMSLYEKDAIEVLTFVKK